MNNQEIIIVKDVFNVSGRGIGIVPYNTLSIELFGKKYNILIEFPNGKYEKSIAFVESLLISATSREEIFTFLLESYTTSDVPQNTKISIIDELG